MSGGWTLKIESTIIIKDVYSVGDNDWIGGKIFFMRYPRCESVAKGIEFVPEIEI